ncbi:MAG: putative amidohydrolase YtcJ [Candidatus Paceibacteria bacterium]|jgi:predicted amidohydrolase YtcJ
MLFTLALTCALLGPVQTPSAAEDVSSVSTTGHRRVLIHGGRIYLGNAEGSAVEAILVEDGRVLIAGPLPELGVDFDEPGLGKIDLKGAVAVPGLQDAHGQVEALGACQSELDLRGLESFEAVLDVVAEAALSADAGSWIIGWGWDQEAWETQEYPHHARLSEVSGTHPVLLRSIGGDALMVNAVVLRKAQMLGPLEPPPRIPGGRVLVDEQSHATGIFFGNAQKQMLDLLPQVEGGALEARLLQAQEQLLALGVTCVHDMGVSLEALNAYQDLRERGLLKIRIVAYLDGSEGFGDAGLVGVKGLSDDRDLFTVAGTYFALDGSLATRSAALLQDYSDMPGERGSLLMTNETLTVLVHETWQAGLQPVVGAHGDLANRVALDTYQRMFDVDKRFLDLRPRIEHAQLIAPRDFPRFPELLIAPTMQAGCSMNQGRLLDTRLGVHRSRVAQAWRSLAPGWKQLAFGSNSPAGNVNPLHGLHAIRVQRPLESLGTNSDLGAKRLGGLGALAGFTRGAAHAALQEDRRGQLLPGFWADLTILDLDPVDVAPEKLLTGKVLMTIINGEIVYPRE